MDLKEGSIPLRERRTLADEWREFAERVVPADAGPVQRVEMRRAWYAGAATMFGLVNELDPDAEPTELDVAYLQRIHRELMTFGDDVLKGRA